jgi:hypothetical protein
VDATFNTQEATNEQLLQRLGALAPALLPMAAKALGEELPEAPQAEPTRFKAPLPMGTGY